MQSTYLLVSHGSQDPRPEIATQHLVKLLCHKIQNYLPYTANSSVTISPKCENLVGTAFLELRPEPLHVQIIKFARSAGAWGYDTLKIIPLFLLPGVHVMEDIPVEVTLAKKYLGQDIKICIQPYLGSHPSLKSLLTKQSACLNVEAKILLAHGSRRPGSQEAVEAIAAALGAVTAYWAHLPSLELRVRELVSAGYRRIAIFPYFLFTGGITDAIALAQEELKLLFPEVSFQLAEPLGASEELADLIWELMEK